MRVSQQTVLGALSSTPVPLSGNFTVTGASKSRRQAMAIANDASNALVAYVASLNNNSGHVRRLWAQLQAAAAQLATAQTQALVAQQAISQAKGHPTSAELKALATARAAVDTAATNE